MSVEFHLPVYGWAVSCEQMAEGRKKKLPDEGTAVRDARSGRKDMDLVAKRLLAAAEFKNTDRVLEIGCGRGALSVEIARVAGYVTGVDHSNELLAAAQDRVLISGILNLSFQQIGGSHLPFEEETFDVAVCLGALHLFADPGQILKEMVRVLKSPGRLCVADIVGAEDNAMREAHSKIEQARYDANARLFSRSEFQDLIAAGPLEITAHDYWAERSGLEQWMPLAETSRAKRDKVSHMLIAAAKKKTTDLKIEVSGKTVTFERQWALITAEKTGSA